MARIPVLTLVLLVTSLAPAGRWVPGATPAAALQIQVESADSLYRSARTSLNGGDHRRAASLFRELVDRFPDSPLAADALYWFAFASYRIGGEEHLRAALAALEEQESRFPNAASAGDARALAIRIRGALAQMGDPEAAARIAEAAARAAERQAEREAELAARQAELLERQAERQAELVERQAEREAEIAERQAEREAELLERQAEREAELLERQAEREAELAERAAEAAADCPDEENDLRIAALHALQRLDPGRAMPLLRKVLAQRDPCAIPLRQMAVFVVADQESPESLEILLEVARDDPDPRVRADAVHWLGEVEDPRAVDALADILSRSSEPEILERALYALSQHESPRAGEILREYASRSDVPDELRGKAIYWLAESDDSGASLDFLAALFHRPASDEMKETILYAISQTDQQEAASWLLEVALDPGQPIEVRKKALYWAGEMDEAPVDRLLALYDRTEDAEFKQQLIYVYSQREEPAAVDKLIAIARTEPNLELRKQALFWLSESDDPRVVDLLGEIISQ